MTALPRSIPWVRLVALIICAIGTQQPALSAELPAPTDKVILVVTGNITNTNAPGRAEFDYGMLEQLGMIEENIATTWTGNDGVFKGVLSKKVLEYVGATGSRVRATAVNDYSVNIPIEDLTNYSTLLATSLNGERLKLRTRGPVWIVYNPADSPQVGENELNSRMIWQLAELDIN